MCKYNSQNSENVIFAKKKSGLLSRSIQQNLCIKFTLFILIYEAMIAKLSMTYVWLKLGWSDPIVMKLKLDMSCHLLNAHNKFQIDISHHVEKSLEMRTDGFNDGNYHGIICPFFKQAYKNSYMCLYFCGSGTALRQLREIPNHCRVPV